MPLLILLQFLHTSDIQHLHEFQNLFIAVHQGFEPGLPHNLPVEKDVPKAQLRDIVLEHLYQYRVIPFECDEPYDGGNSGYLVTQSCIVLVFILVYLIYPADVLEYFHGFLSVGESGDVYTFILQPGEFQQQITGKDVVEYVCLLLGFDWSGRN